MQQNQKTISSVGWLVAAIGFCVIALAHTLGLAGALGMRIFGYSRGAAGYFLLAAGDAVAIVALFLKKRDILLPVGFALMSLGEFVLLFTPFTGDRLFSFLGFICLCAIALAYFTTILPENAAGMIRDYGRALWFAPAALFATSFILRILFGWRWDDDNMLLSVQRLILYAPTAAFATMWIISPNENPRFDFSVFKRSPAPVQPAQPVYSQQQGYQQPVQPQQPVYRQPVQPQQPPVYQPPVETEVKTPDGPVLTTNPDLNVGTQLKVYQELLQDGVITAEEYEQKRREILGL